MVARASCPRPQKVGLCLLLFTAAVVLCVQLSMLRRSSPVNNNLHRSSASLRTATDGGMEQRLRSVLDQQPKQAIKKPASLPTATDGGMEQELRPVIDQQPKQAIKKPRFVIHCGPMKTGTTSLQKQLMWLMQPFLEKDGWHYIGGKDPMEHIPMDDPYKFLELFEKEAKELRKLNMNMIRSREQYSQLFYHEPWMYERLRDMLSDDWDVLIVAGYRPYFEWLPSFWYQGQRMKHSDPKHPEKRIMNPWTNKVHAGVFSLVEPMFPGFFDFWTKKSRFTDSIIDPAKPYFPVKVYDIHDPRGARTAFLCDIIGEDNVPSACQESIRLDQEKQPERDNTSNLKEVQYDAIALAAAKRGMVDMEKWARATVIDEIIKRQEEELHRTVVDFPLACPTEEYIEKFWETTRNLDVQCMPEKSENDPDHLRKLREKFLAAVEAKKFCLVDADAVLAESEWREFFQKFA